MRNLVIYLALSSCVSPSPEPTARELNPIPRKQLNGQSLAAHARTVVTQFDAANGAILTRGKHPLAMALAPESDALGDEWWTPTAYGIEHGWTLQESASTQWSTEVNFPDATVTADPSGNGAWVTGADGERWYYGWLLAWDAAGKALDIDLSVSGAAVQLKVDLTGATFPVTIDPAVVSLSDVYPVSAAPHSDAFPALELTEFRGATALLIDRADHGGFQFLTVQSSGFGTQSLQIAYPGGYVSAGQRPLVADTDGDGIDEWYWAGVSSTLIGTYTSVNETGPGNTVNLHPLAIVRLRQPFATEPENELFAQESYTFAGSSASLGAAMAAGYDADDDGTGDLIVGDPGANGGSGRLYIVSMGTTSRETLEVEPTTANGGFGAQIAVDDLLGTDDCPDLIVASPGADRVEITQGCTTGSTLVLDGDADSEFGSALNISDVDADGWLDLVVGAPAAGTVTVFYGPQISYANSDELFSGTTGDSFGQSIAFVDSATPGNGRLLIGAPNANGGAGVVHTYSITTAGISAAQLWSPATAASRGFGAFLSTTADWQTDAAAIVSTQPWDSSVLVTEAIDADNDGFQWRIDCDDKNKDVYPGATEILGNWRDDNCDGKELCYEDKDGDFYRTNTTVVSANLSCGDAGEAWPALSTLDCDDDNQNIHPFAQEIIGDEKDQDCDNKDICFQNWDDDGFRTDNWYWSQDLDCSDTHEARFDKPNGDCGDFNVKTYPGAPEIVGDEQDQSCDGTEICYVDADGDKFHNGAEVASPNLNCRDAGEAFIWYPSGDCNDADAKINPWAIEIVGDEIDQDCDGKERCYVDADEDGYRGLGSPAGLDQDCDDPGEARAGEPAGDCRDWDAKFNPGKAEIPGDGADQNCDNAEICYADADNDKTRSAGTLPSADLDCIDLGEAYSFQPIDCKDDNAKISPYAQEITANGADDNCDGKEICYQDKDQDTFGATYQFVADDGDMNCDEPLMKEANDGTDCDDSYTVNAAKRFPGNTEIVGDHIDGDCTYSEICFLDTDDDGYLDQSERTTESFNEHCFDPHEGAASDPRTDCDDWDAGDHPGAFEIVGNSDDESCDGKETCYDDDDDDGVLDNSLDTRISADADCFDAHEGTHTDLTNDCDDFDAGDKPGAIETVANGDDEDCDGKELCFVDGDGDSYGTSQSVVSPDLDCSSPGESPNALDCDDTQGNRHPAMIEMVANGIDDDCNLQELCFADADHDGFGGKSKVSSIDLDCDDLGEASTSFDCDDSNPNANPNAQEEIANGRDENCDGGDFCYLDADGDTYGGFSVVWDPNFDCSAPGKSAVLGDCDDLSVHAAERFPGNAEILGDGIDQDCTLTEVCYLDGDDDGYLGELFQIVISADEDCNDANEGSQFDPNTDCDDADAGDHPGAEEKIGNSDDENCDGIEICYDDDDNDGSLDTEYDIRMSVDTDCRDANEGTDADPLTDCDDFDANDWLGAPEVAGNSDDEDCDGGELCFVDSDNDDYGTHAIVASADADCNDLGEAANALDCDDSRSGVHPNQVEVVGNGLDDDCNGLELCYIDVDNDGYGTNAAVASNDPDCDDLGEAAVAGDCDDTNPNRSPGLNEIVANAIDDDCDGWDDCYHDGDSDGFGSKQHRPQADLDCNDPFESSNSLDCKDNWHLAYPGAPLIPGHVNQAGDDDCDGHEECYVDADDDNYGVPVVINSADQDCADAHEAVVATDCDDVNAARSPGMSEIVANGVDENCFFGDTCYQDTDGDGFGSALILGSVDLDCADLGESNNAQDCDDGAAADNPNATEIVGNFDDEDCDGVDSCYVDADNDNVGSAAVLDGLSADCTADVGRAPVSGDCAESDARMSPLLPEIPGNGIDDDCNGFETCAIVDQDSDGAPFRPVVSPVQPGGGGNGWEYCDPSLPPAIMDCDDSDGSVGLGTPEILNNGFDEDCDGWVE